MTKQILTVVFFVFFLQVSQASSLGNNLEETLTKSQFPGVWELFDIDEASAPNSVVRQYRMGVSCYEGKPKGQKGENTLLFCFGISPRLVNAKGQKIPSGAPLDNRFRLTLLEITLLKNTYP